MRVVKSKWKNVLKAQKEAAIKEETRRRIHEFVNRMTEIELEDYEEMLAKQREEDKYNRTRFR